MSECGEVLADPNPLNALAQRDSMTERLQHMEECIAGASLHPLISPSVCCRREAIEESMADLLQTCRLEYSTDNVTTRQEESEEEEEEEEEDVGGYECQIKSERERAIVFDGSFPVLGPGPLEGHATWWEGREETDPAQATDLAGPIFAHPRTSALYSGHAHPGGETHRPVDASVNFFGGRLEGGSWGQWTTGPQ